MEIYERYQYTKHPEDCRLYFLTLFNGGFRRAEAIKVRMDMVSYNKEAIMIRNAPVIKKRKYVTRNVPIQLDDKINPLAKEFLECIKDIDTEYLLTAKLPFGMGDSKVGSVSSKTVYNRIREMRLFPHALRAYRAMHLVAVKDFRAKDLVAWFEWKSAEMALHYTKTRAMLDRLGIKNPPRPGERII